MGVETIIAGIGLVLGAVGTGVQVKAANDASEASKRAENLREQQMNLEAARQRRQVVRNALKARSMALNSATNQGASRGSGLQGGYGQIGSEAGGNILGINQGTAIGAGIFETNRDAAGAAALASFGQGLGSLGGALVNNSETIGKIATYAGTPKTTG